MVDTSDLSDLEVVAKTLDGEAGNQGEQGQRAVANVVMRRAALGWQGERTPRGVCLHPEQFSCWLGGHDTDRIMASDNPSCVTIAQLALAGSLADITDGATHYYDTSISPPYWAENEIPCAKIGDLVFYNLA